LTGGHEIVELTSVECGGCTRGRETGENGREDNAGKNGNEKATHEIERAEINTVKMKMLKEEESRCMIQWPNVHDLRTHLMMLRA
jgi:hypothetical protein